MGRKVMFFMVMALMFISYFGLAQAAELTSDKTYTEPEILTSLEDYKEYFSETFDDKYLYKNKVMKQSQTIWNINTVKEQRNSITDTGALELGGAQYMQRAVLDEKLWAQKQDYAMEFTINVQKMGNEGHYGRPIVVIIPRSKDKNFNEYYAVTYYMETIGSNQYKCKWAIINTAAPTKMEALVEGYYLLRENVDYTGRLVIHNTSEGNVDIKFYIDGPLNPVEEYKPLLEYIDSSPYKILSGETGPAFGMVGYSDDGWGQSPIVRYDNIKLYDFNKFRKYEEQLKKYVRVNPKDIKTNNAYGEIRYLINKGILSGYTDNTFRPNDNVSVAQFLKMLINLSGEEYSNGKDYWAENYIKRGIELGIIDKNDNSNFDRPITKYDVALMITRFNGNPVADKIFASAIKDNTSIKDKIRLNAVLYNYYEGYLRLDNSFNFMGNEFINRSECAIILMRMIDAGYRKVNYNLELPNILSSGAVLQGNKKIPVWGRGVSGETIKVSFKKQVKTSVVKNGHWYLELEPEPYGGPYSMTITSTKDEITLRDIYVGEVFIVAGQSNAEMYLNECYGAEETKRKFINNKNLRLYDSEQILAVKPNFTTTGQWQPSYDWVIDWAPAVGAFFVERLVELNNKLEDVKIGLIPMTYGGTTIEIFMPNTITAENNFIQKDDEPIMSGFWNGFMEANAPYGVKGVIYYQGENSTHLGYDYELFLRDYLRGLRKEFNDPNLPVMLVQIAGYGNNYNEDSWPIIRDVQMNVANTTDNTGLITAIDLSDENPLEIHPKEKKEIGIRLAYLAMDMIYGKDLEHRSAEIKSYQFENNKVIVDFDYTFGPLYIIDNITKGFEILDDNNIWHEAQAKVNEFNNTVEIWCDNVPLPKGARYAWHNYPDISLYNNVSLPTLPFRVINAPKFTESNFLKITSHMLNKGDAIVNITRNSQFRVINRLDNDTLSHEYTIKDQTTGDTIEKLLRLENSIAQSGTTETTIKIFNHGLSVGDWIRNNTRGWEPRRVNAVLDNDTIVVTRIIGQESGDDISRYKFYGKTVAR